MGAWLAIFAAALSACAVGPDYERPELPVTPGFRDTPEASASIADSPWFDVFTDPVLRQLVDEALANNTDLSIAIARVQQARDTAAIARSPLFPQIGYTAWPRADARPRWASRPGGAPTANAFWPSRACRGARHLGRIRRNAEAGRAGGDAFRRGVVLSRSCRRSPSRTSAARARLELQMLNDSVRRSGDVDFSIAATAAGSPRSSTRCARAALARLPRSCRRPSRRSSRGSGSPCCSAGRRSPRRARALRPRRCAQIPAGSRAAPGRRPGPDRGRAEPGRQRADRRQLRELPRLGLTALGGALSRKRRMRAARRSGRSRARRPAPSSPRARPPTSGAPRRPTPKRRAPATRARC